MKCVSFTLLVWQVWHKLFFQILDFYQSPKIIIISRTKSRRVIEYLFSEYGNDITYSLMSQYTPMKTLDKDKYPELARRVTTYEYTKLIDHALSLGITNAFMQDGRPADESFIPEFSLEGV